MDACSAVFPRVWVWGDLTAVSSEWGRHVNLGVGGAAPDEAEGGEAMCVASRSESTWDPDDSLEL